ncbi:MAG: DegT/DnrJ/EryC1/StrS family aminotransferase [Victivallales bacterium]|nr:DegT/DnrJ/EryC1/StrS family aminotransferase [Victivallales bacterium]
MSHLALLGGTPVMKADEYKARMFHWPIVNDAMRKAQLDVLEAGNMSGTDISKRFEQEFAKWNGTKYALTHNTGTASLTAAMYGVGLGPGDELICTSVTYWASCTGALSLGAAVVFCDIDPENSQMDPASFEAHITPRTKAVMVVHYEAHPADMDAIMAIAKKHGIKVIEDVSHAQGGHYKGRMLGTFGDAAGMSLMSGKSFAIGEGGMMLTNDPEVYRRAIRFGHYDRISEVYAKEEYADTNIVPVGGVKNRMHQISAAIGLEQLKKYPAEVEEITKAMTYFWDGLADVKGIHKIFPKWENSDKAGWYASHFRYDPEAFGGISNVTFSKALNAECAGKGFYAGCNFPLHLSSFFYDFDVYGHGRPTAGLNLPPGTDLRKLTGELPVSAHINSLVLGEPWFKHFEPEYIDRYIEAVHKVAEYHTELLDSNEVQEFQGGMALTHRKTK